MNKDFSHPGQGKTLLLFPRTLREPPECFSLRESLIRQGVTDETEIRNELALALEMEERTGIKLNIKRYVAKS